MVLLLNAVAILSEDRFLARGRSHPYSHTLESQSNSPTVGWSRNQREAGFGQQDSSVKVRIGELIAGVRLVTRGAFGKLIRDGRS
jgi:Yos1-like